VDILAKKKEVKKTAKNVANKTTKKVANKTAKNVSKKKEVKSNLELKKVSGDECFYMIDGSVLSDLNELSDAFDRMSEDCFNYHVNEEKNDFVNWVRFVFNEEDLASSLVKQKNAEKCHVTMLKFFLNKK
jgi:hypothetical protein